MECVLQPPPIMSTFHDIMGENVPFDASVAMVTARVFLSRQNANVQSLCITWASGLHKHGLPVQSPHVPFFFTFCLSDSKQPPVLLPPTPKSRVGKKTSLGGESLESPWSRVELPYKGRACTFADCLPSLIF